MLGYKSFRVRPIGIGGPPDDSSPPDLVELSRAVIDGPETMAVDKGYMVTTTVSYPVTGTISVPIAYTWRASGELPFSVTAPSIRSAAIITWPTPGIKAITVTAENADSWVTANYTVTVREGWWVYLPLVLRNTGSR